MSQATDHPTPATPLPWRSNEWGYIKNSRGNNIGCIENEYGDLGSDEKDAAYAVHAANAYPALVAEVARLREALREIADMGGEIRSNPIVRTIAGKARAALAPPTT